MVKNNFFFTMMHKEVIISKAFQELHGERARLSTLLLVYFAGLITAGLVVSQLAPFALPAWQILLVSILFLDIASGAVANLSTSTNQYYQGKPKLRLVFILMHIFHPSLLIMIFPASAAYSIFVMVFTLVSLLGLSTTKDQEFQQNLAATLITIGIGLSFFFSVPITVLYAFGPLFMVKLLLGFGVQRPSFLSPK